MPLKMPRILVLFACMQGGYPLPQQRSSFANEDENSSASANSGEENNKPPKRKLGQKFTNAELRTAATAYCENPAAAEMLYGTIASWGTYSR